MIEVHWVLQISKLNISSYITFTSTICTRDVQYIDILQYSLLQYNTIRLIKNIDIIINNIAYCNILRNIYCLQSCKYPIITLQI